MKVLDPEGLLGGLDLVQEVLERHPFAPPLATVIDTVEVVVSEAYGIAAEQIRTDLAGRNATLGLGRSSSGTQAFRYVLFHEFGHVADRARPDFGYSDALDRSLSSRERVAVMELWNVFIDARLNAAGVFELGYQPPCCSRRHGRLPSGIEGKLQGHAVMMESQGVSYDQALEVVLRFWDRPESLWSFADMVLWVRDHAPEPAGRQDVRSADAPPPPVT